MSNSKKTFFSKTASSADSQDSSQVSQVSQVSAASTARRVSSMPIPVHVTSTLFDAPAPDELIDNKPYIVRCARRGVTAVFGLWMRVASYVARRAGWFPSVEPYIGYGTDRYARLICRTVYAPARGHHSALKRGIYAMLVVPAVRVKVTLSIDGIPLEKVQVGDCETYDKVESAGVSSVDYCISDRAGYLDLVTERALCAGQHTVSYTVNNRDSVKSSLFAISSSASIGVISDVDDTIMVTQAPSPIRAAYNLLIMNPAHRSRVPGMASLFAAIKDFSEDSPFFYLSTSPWNVEASIRHFIDREGFPQGPLLLRDLDPRPKTFVPNGPQHKMEFASQLMDDFPDMRFVLIGDDGQKDPLTYANIIRKYPGRVLAVAIRQLHSDDTVDHFRKHCIRDFGMALSSSHTAYTFAGSTEDDFDLKEDSSVENLRTIEVKNCVGTLHGVPFFVSPDGEGLKEAILPYLSEVFKRS